MGLFDFLKGKKKENKKRNASNKFYFDEIEKKITKSQKTPIKLKIKTKNFLTVSKPKKKVNVIVKKKIVKPKKRTTKSRVVKKTVKKKPVRKKSSRRMVKKKR